MKRVFLILIVIAVIAGVGVWLAASRRGTASSPGSPSGAAPPRRDAPTGALPRAPDLALQDYAGRTLRLADFRGKPVVVNSWAAWCPFCREELPDLAAVQEEFGDQVTVIAVDRAESLETAKRYSDDLGVTEKLVMLLDPRDSFYQAIGGFSMPETIFVEREGSIVFHKRGPMSRDEIRQRTQQLLQE